jgi:hypothetical protein
MNELKEGGYLCSNEMCLDSSVYCACGNKAIEELDVCKECK